MKEELMHRGLASLTGRALLIAGLLAIQIAAAMASPGTNSVSIGTPQRIALTPAGRQLEAAPAVRVLSSSDEAVRMEFDLPAINIQQITVEGETFDVVDIEGGGQCGEIGSPMLPTFARLVQIPDQTGATITVTATETQEIPDVRPIPMQPDDGSDFVINRAAYASAGYPADEPAALGEPAIARALRVVPITFQPVRYDPARQTIEVATRVEVEVHFAGVDLRNAMTRHHNSIPDSFDRMYRATVVNYTGAGRGQGAGLGKVVIITPNNSSVISALQRLIEWRKRKGFDVYLATTAETGTTNSAIQSWLRNAYTTWEDPPEYIVLIGDTSGSISLPYWTYGSYNGESDHPYVQLDGSDILADAHIGRISVDSVDRLNLYIEKIVSYESTPYMTDTAWYKRACVTGDPTQSGITCVQTMQWVKEKLLENGYAEVDTIWTAPFASQMSTKLNRGDTVFGYRGYYHMSSFDTSYILALTNGRKMPFGVFPTCDTGGFASGYARSEAWIRAGVTGSTPQPTGGIAAIGTATTGTHTRYNNVVIMGAWQAPFMIGNYHFGESLTQAKYALYTDFNQADPTGCANFTHWNNLMGDPAGELWTDIPQAIQVTHPSQIAIGANAVTVSVTKGGFPLAGAYVCLFQDGVTQEGGYTGTDGSVDVPVNTPAAGTLMVTVTKHDHMPYLGTISISSSSLFVGHNAHTIDDDNSGTSSGNGDGNANPGERIELRVQLRNFGTQSATNVNATLTADDPYVTITDNAETFGTIAGGATAWCADDFDFQISGTTPSGHIIHFGMDVTSGSNTWHSVIEVPVLAAAFTYEAVTLTGFGTIIDPGESGEISVRIRNNGNAAGTGITATLISQSQWVTVTDPSGAYPNIAVGATGENTSNRFGLSASAQCFQGHLAPMLMIVGFSGSAIDSVPFVLSIGTASSDDPTGPDHYGYYAFDNTDTGYPDAPTYNWVEIAANQGGPGTSLGLSDDDNRLVTLPFPFTYYGETFTTATICMNGWMSMGQTYLVNFHNVNIPAAGAPPYMIAPMWDGLYPSGQNTVYHWTDAPNHRYIVEWSRVLNDQGGAVECFEVILYDPAYYTTETGDGMILFQFNTFNNADSDGLYSTTGIENGDLTDGVMYQFFNRYNAGAATITSGRAIKFIAKSGRPRGTLAGTVRNASNGLTPIEGATIRVIETGDTFQTGPDGTYIGTLIVGRYTIEASHPSFRTQTISSLWIVENQTTHADFSLVDIVGPAFSGTTAYTNTTNTQGPYEITTNVVEYSGIDELSLHYIVNGTGWVTEPLEAQGGGVYRAEIPGQPEGSMISYYLYGRDVATNVTMDPPAGPAGAYTFWVLAPLLSVDVETGGTDWTHYVVEGGYTDQWHVSTTRNHTPGGSSSWKFGDTGGGNYTSLADGALETEPFTLTAGGTFTFWHWMAAEASGTYPGYAYDGGLLEISVDGGNWESLTPVGGYTHLVRAGGNPGPFPAETPIFSGSFDWTQTTVDLSGVSGEVRIRFRFGSDGNTELEGWYVDDVEVVSLENPFSGSRELELIPSTVALYQNTPNPFGSGDASTVIRFDLPHDAAVRLQVFDAGGRLVRTLVDNAVTAGQHRVAWDGRDAADRPVGSGVYFYILATGREQHPRQMLVLR
jgi:hypothetical protein